MVRRDVTVIVFGLAVVLLTGCASRTRAPEPPAERLRVVTTVAMPDLWSGWWVGVDNEQVWFRPSHDWALPRDTVRLDVSGHWYIPEKAAWRQLADTVGQAGMFLPPLFLAVVTLIPDATCAAAIDLPRDDGRGMTVGIDWEGPDGSARVYVKSGWEARLLVEAPCLHDGRPVHSRPVGDGKPENRG
jgi:hypothetical protein